jgi:hypothetical protein
MQQAIDKEIKARRAVQDMTTELPDAHGAIDWGYSDWKSEKTSDAVRKLERTPQDFFNEFFGD